MGTIHRVPSELPPQQPVARADAHRGAANASPEIPDQNREMQRGSVTAPQKVSQEVKTGSVDIRQAESHQVRRRPRLDKHA